MIFSPGGRSEYVLAISFTSFIYYISFLIIRGSKFFEMTLFPEKYTKSSLSDEMKQCYLKKLESVMREQRPFLDNLFSLKKLSALTGIPLNYLSQIINEELHLTFFEYTKKNRIAEAQKLITDPQNLNVNIEEIASQVGYNSKSAFNKAFLEITKSTPLQYKKSRSL
jgi:AraC-like DNA-binding protein